MNQNYDKTEFFNRFNPIDSNFNSILIPIHRMRNTNKKINTPLENCQSANLCLVEIKVFHIGAAHCTSDGIHHILLGLGLIGRRIAQRRAVRKFSTCLLRRSSNRLYRVSAASSFDVGIFLGRNEWFAKVENIIRSSGDTVQFIELAGCMRKRFLSNAYD